MTDSSRHPTHFKFAPAPLHCGKMEKDLESMKKRQKRGRFEQKAKLVREVYQGFSYTPMPSSGRSGTPHRLFEESYQVQIASEAGNNPHLALLSPIIHKHANGLCVVTAGKFELPDVKDVRFLKQTAEMNATNTTKSDRKDAYNTKPHEALAVVELGDGAVIDLPSCVLGNIIELNDNLTVATFVSDPLQDGYLAIIKPVGIFPPA